MIASFRNAPLVEIVAELRWPSQQARAAVPGSVDPAMFPVMEPAASNRLDEVFMRFGGECYQMGFQAPRGWFPRAFPSCHSILCTAIAGRTTRRDRRRCNLIGAGLFSANALPPYRSWRAFAQILADGVRSLVRLVPRTKRDSVFERLPSVHQRVRPDFLRDGRLRDSFPTCWVSGSSCRKAFGRLSPVEPSRGSATPIPAANGLRIAMMVGEGVVAGASASCSIHRLVGRAGRGGRGRGDANLRLSAFDHPRLVRRVDASPSRIHGSREA